MLKPKTWYRRVESTRLDMSQLVMRKVECTHRKSFRETLRKIWPIAFRLGCKMSTFILWNCCVIGCHYLPARNKETSSKNVMWTPDIATADQNPSTECKFNINGKLHNKYLDCNGEWISVTAKYIKSIFNLTTQYQKKIYLKVYISWCSKLRYIFFETFITYKAVFIYLT